MTVAILTLCGGMIGLVMWFLNRKSARDLDPAAQNQKVIDEIDREIAKDDESGANTRLDDAIARHRRLHPAEGDSFGSNGSPPKG